MQYALQAPQTQKKAQSLAACGHVSASSQSLRFILSLRMNSSFITSRPGSTQDHRNKDPELQCLLKVKQDLSSVLIFQHAISNAK